MTRAERRRGERVVFDADCACGQRHQMTGWQSATPGLVVWREDSPANNSCGWDYPDGQEFWSIWHEPAQRGSAFMGFGDPESAMRQAEDLGSERDWTKPGRGEW